MKATIRPTDDHYISSHVTLHCTPAQYDRVTQLAAIRGVAVMTLWLAAINIGLSHLRDETPGAASAGADQ